MPFISRQGVISCILCARPKFYSVFAIKSVWKMATRGDLSLSDKELTELKEQVITILESCDGRCLELHLFKKVYKDTFGEKFEAHYRKLRSKKLKNVLKALDCVIFLEQPDENIIKIKLKDQMEYCSNSPGHVVVKSVSSTAVEGVNPEESITSAVAPHIHEPALSLVSAAAVKISNLLPLPTPTQPEGMVLKNLDLTPPDVTGACGMTQLKKKVPVLPLVGYDKLLTEMGTPNTGTPVSSTPQLNAVPLFEDGTPDLSEESLHQTGMASGLLSLSGVNLTELKNQVIRILKSCDGRCMELQRFKKVYRDTFGKRFLNPKKLEKAMPALDDVIALNQSGNKMTILLKDQAAVSGGAAFKISSPLPLPTRTKAGGIVLKNLDVTPPDVTGACGMTQLNKVGTPDLSEEPLHHTSMASGLLSLSGVNLTELKNQVIRILKYCDGRCMELQQFKKVYRDTFGKKFLNPKRLKKAMPALDDVIVLKQSGNKMTIKLKDQAAERSDLFFRIAQTVYHDSDRSRAIGSEPSSEDISSVVTPPELSALSPVSAGAALKMSSSLPLPTPTQLEGMVLRNMHVPPPDVTEACGITQLNTIPVLPLVGYDKLLTEMDTPNTGTPVYSSPQLNAVPLCEDGTPDLSEKSLHHTSMTSGLLSLSGVYLTELKNQVIRILKSYDGRCMELQQFKKVYRDTFGKKFLNAKKLKKAMPALDDVIVLNQSGNKMTIKLKDLAAERSDSFCMIAQTVPHDSDRSRSIGSEPSSEDIASVVTPELSALSPVSAGAAFKMSSALPLPTPTQPEGMHVTRPDVTGACGITQLTKVPVLPLVGYDKLLTEMGTPNTETPVYSSPQLNAVQLGEVGTPDLSEEPLHHTSMASGLLSLSGVNLTELKNQVIRILKYCDGRCMELQRFKKVYRDTFGKRFLKPKKLEKAMPALDDVIVLNQSGNKMTIKLKDQAGDRSDSFSRIPQTVSHESDKSRAIGSELSRENTASVVTPQLSALSPVSAGAAFKMATPTQPEVDGDRNMNITPSDVTGTNELTQPSPLLQQQGEMSANGVRLSLTPGSYERLMTERGTLNTEKSVSVSQVKALRVREVGTPGPFEKAIDHAQQLINTSKTKTARNCSLQDVNSAAEDIITSLSEEGKYVSLEVVKARLCQEFGKSNFSAFGFKRDNAVPCLHDLIQLQAKVSLFVHAYVMTNSICTLHELSQSLADLGSKSDFEELKLGPLLQQPVVYDMFKTPSDRPSPPHITTIQILKHLEKYIIGEDLWRTKVDLKDFLKYLCEQYDCDTPYELGVRIQSVGLAISVR